MEEKDKLRVLYDGVSSYMDIGNYDDFKNAMRDTSKRQKFFDGVSSYMDIGTNDQFNSFMDGYFGQQQPAQRVDVSDVEAQRQPQVPTITTGQVDNEPASPYGDLTSDNFVAARQRGSEIAAKRKEIQRALDSDTEMEPLTLKQRNEYERQLKALDNEMNGINAFVDEWNKTEEAKAYYDAQKRAVDDFSARVDQMQADRNRERASKKADEEGKKGFWQRFAEGLAAAENPITEETVAAITDPTNNDLRTARNEVRNAKNQLRLEEMRMNGEQRGLGFLRGMETANYYELMPAIGMADAMSILQLSKDIKDGKELTDSQKLLKEAMEARAGVDFAYRDNNTLWERIGQSAPEQLMFTLQFVIGAGVTGATSAGERVAARSAERAAKRLAKKEATSAARNFVATRVVPELEGMAVSSAIQTFANPLSVAGMVEDFERRYAGDIYYDKEGNLHVFDNDRSAGQAAYQAIASAWIENFTEYAGGNITKSAKLLDSKMFDLAGKFDNVMKKVGASKIQDVFRIPQQLGRLTQIGSAPEEFLEEELGSVMNALMATDAQRGESYGDAFKNTISSSFAGEQQLETFLSCAITSMLLGGGGNAVNGVRNAGLRKSVNQDVEQSKALLGKVRGIDIEGLDNMIENGRVSDISAYLKEQSDANNWNKDEQGAAVSYVLNRSRQIGVKHNDATAIEAEQAEYRRQAEDMVNRWDGRNIYNVTYTDRNGETQEGTIVNGRVHYNTNEDGTYTFDPYISSGMLAIRRADGSVEQVAGRNVTALNNVATIEEQLESQNQTIGQLMREEFEKDGMLPTIESVWGGNLVPNVTQFQNGRYTYLGQDDNGLYAFANNDKRTSKDNPIVYLTERQLIEYGLSLNLENAQATGDTEAVEKAQEDIDFLKRLDEITADAGAKGQWDVVKAYAQRKVLFDANGGIIPNESNEQATAAYLLAISEGSFENAITSVDQTIAALGTPQQTEVTDNAADNAAMNNAAATVDADKARQIDFYTNVRNRLTAMQQGKEEADAEEAAQVEANTPVSQMEVGQQFPVQWHGQPAMATVMGKDADGRSVVTVRDMDGEDIEAGIDDWSDQQWEAVRQKPQEEENFGNPLVKVGDRVDVDWSNGTTETVTVRGIEGNLVLITTSDGKPYDFPMGWLSSGRARVLNNSVESTQNNDENGQEAEQTPVQPTPTPQGPAPAPQPVSQNETPEPTPQQTPTPVQPEAAPQQEQPQAEYPKDKQGKPQYDQIDDPNVFLQALVDEWGEDALGALDDIIEDTKEGLEQKSKLEQRRINKRLAMLEAVRGMLQPQEEISGNQWGISPNPTVEEVPTEQPTDETSVERPVAETPQEEAPSETPMESAGEGTEQKTEEAPEETEVETVSEKPWYGTIDEAPTRKEMGRGQAERLFESGERAFRNASMEIPSFQFGVENPIGLTYELFEQKYREDVGDFFFKGDKPFLKDFYDYFVRKMEEAVASRYNKTAESQSEPSETPIQKPKPKEQTEEPEQAPEQPAEQPREESNQELIKGAKWDKTGEPEPFRRSKKGDSHDASYTLGKKTYGITRADADTEEVLLEDYGTYVNIWNAYEKGEVLLSPELAAAIKAKIEYLENNKEEKPKKKSEKAKQTEQPIDDSDIDALIEDYKKKAAATNKIWSAWLADPSGKPADYGTTRDEEAKAYGRVREALAGVPEEKLAEMENTNYGDSLLNDLIKEERNRRNEQKETEQRFVDGLAKQGEIGKPTKPVSIEKILPEFTSRDEQRPIMNCIYYDPEGYAVASDAYILIASKSQYDPKQEGKMVAAHKIKGVAEKGDEVEGKFMKWRNVISQAKANSAEIDLPKLRDFLAGVKELMKGSKEDATVQVRMPNGAIIGFKPEYLLKFVQGAEAMGVKEIEYIAPNLAITGRSEDGIVLLMPVKISADYSGRLFYYDLSDKTDKTDRTKGTEKAEKTDKTETEPKKQPKAPGKAGSQKIEDVGEKIGGARKDLAQQMSGKIKLDADTFPKMFPKFDLAKLVESGLDPKLAAAVMYLRQAAYAEYKSRAKRQTKEKALSGAKFFAAYAKQVLENGNTDVNFTNSGWEFTDYGKEVIELNIDLYSKIHEKFGDDIFKLDLSGYEIVPISESDIKYSKFYRKNEKGESVEFKPAFEARTPHGFARFEKGELSQAIDHLLNKLENSVSYDKAHPYKLSHYYIPGENNSSYIGVKLGGKVVALTEKGSSAETSKYLREHEAELQEKARRLDEERKQNNKEKGEEKDKWKPQLNLGGGRARVGEDYRNGRDIGADEFRDTFGFRGVEFGNYVTQKERQSYLNEAYDAFMDLADLLGVSPKALSLGGQLGFAIGARGGGGKNAAHYEPEKNVINLTKTSGAGSVAHEWWHALDYYFNRQGDTRKKSATANTAAEDFSEGVRKEMRDAFVSLMERINGGEYFKRSRRLERKLHPGSVGTGYFDKPTELGARAFQDYVQRRLTDKGQVNDFLSSFTPEEQWNGEETTYPYPTGEEADAIDERFDNLFATVQEKEDEDGNTVLFSIDDEAVVSKSDDEAYMKAVESGDMETAQRMVLEAAAKAMPNTKVVDENGMPKIVAHGTPSTFTVFDEGLIGSHNDAGWLGTGFYFYGNNRVYAAGYAQGGPIMNVFLNIENPYYASSEEFEHLAEVDDIAESMGFTEDRKEDGFDGVFYNGDLNEEWVAYYPNQIKSADPVTYDDQGNVIPLSQRFNKRNADIRFSTSNDADVTITEAKELAYNAVRQALANAGIEVEVATKEEVEGLKAEMKTLQDSKGVVRGWVGNDGKIHLTKDGLNAETPIHEYTHLWAEAMQMTNPELWEQIKGLLKGTPEWKRITSMKEYSNLRDDDRIAGEVLAHISGKKNAERMEAEAKRMIDEAPTLEEAAKAANLLGRMRDALKRFWTWVGKTLLGRKGRITVDQVTEMVLSDLTHGVNPDKQNKAKRRKTAALVEEENETERIKSEAQANRTFMKAPNGKPTKLTERQWLQVRTQAFKKWFGDWENDPENASKVVDENGEPMVVYHGGKGEITVFEKNRIGENLDYGTMGSGFYFTSDRENAENYARNAQGEGEPTVVEAFLNIRNAKDVNWNELDGESRKKSEAFTDKAIAKGHDGFTAIAPNKAQWIVAFTPNQIKSATDNNGEFDEGNPDIRFSIDEGTNRIAEEVNRKTGATKEAVVGLARWLKQFWRNYTDYARPIQQMQESIEKSLGRKVRDSEDVARQIYRMPNICEADYKAMNNAFMIPLKNAIGTVIDDYGGDFDTAWNALSQYLIAKHGLERNEWFVKQGNEEDDYAGLTGLAESLGKDPKDYKAVAEQVVADFENAINPNHLDKMWKRINAITDALLQMEYDSGLTDKKHLDELKAGGRFKNYVPLRGFNAKTSGEYFDYDDEGTKTANPIKKMKGRTSLAADPLAAIAEMMQQVILASEKNRVGVKFYNLAVNSNSDLLRRRNIWMEKNVNGNWVEVAPDISEDATPEKVAEILDQFDADMKQKKANGEKVKMGVNKLDITVDSSVDKDTKVLPYNSKKHEVLVYVNGKPKVIYVNGNPEIARVMNEGARKMSGNLLKGLFTLTRWKAQLQTTYSPLFPFRNTPRDVQYMLLNAFILDGAKGWRVASRNVARAMRAVPRLVATEYWTKHNTANLGKLLHSIEVTDLKGNVVENLKGKEAAERILQWWQEFLDNGGETGMIKTLSAEQYEKDLKKSVRDLMEGKREDGDSVLNKLTFGGLEQISRASEDISRFAAYMAYRSTGHSIHQSATYANNATLNFQKKGGGTGAALLRGLFPFINARIRGIAQQIELWRDGTRAQRARLVGVLAWDVAREYIIQQLNVLLISLFAPGDDDDDNGQSDVWDAFEFFSQYKGNNNTVIYLPWINKFTTIPNPQEYAPFMAVGNIWFREKMGWNTSQNMNSQILDMFLGQSPIEISEGGTASGRLLRTLWPGGTEEIAEVLTNENFMGNQIWYDNPYNQSDAMWTKAKDNVPDFLVDFSKWLNKGQVKPVNADWDKFNNPAAWWHLIKGAAGGTGRTIEWAVNTIQKAVNKEGIGIEDMPGLRAWFTGTDPDDYKYGILNSYLNLNDFYKTANEINNDYKKMPATTKEVVKWETSLDKKVLDMMSIFKTGKNLDGDLFINKAETIDAVYDKVKALRHNDNRTDEQDEELKRLEATLQNKEYQCVEACKLVIMANQMQDKPLDVIRPELKSRVPKKVNKRVYENTHKAMGDWDYIKAELDRRMNGDNNL